MNENENNSIEGRLQSLRESASFEAPAGLEAKVMQRIEKKKLPLGLRFASAAVLILAVSVGGLLYRPWESPNQATRSVPLEPTGDSKVLLDPSSGLEKQKSAPDKKDFSQAKNVEQNTVVIHESRVKKESVQMAAPIISAKSRVEARKRSDVANSSRAEDSMAENTMSEDSSEQSFGLGMQDEFDRSESTKLLRKSMELRQEARGAKKAQRAVAPSAAAEAFNQEDPRDKRKVIESWLASLRQQKYAELDRQLRVFAIGPQARAFSPDDKEMLFSNKEILFSNKEISNWRIMLKNEKYELLEEEWSQKLHKKN